MMDLSYIETPTEATVLEGLILAIRCIIYTAHRTRTPGLSAHKTKKNQHFFSL